MPRPALPIFDTIYDWETGTWYAVVRGDLYGRGVVAKRGGFELEVDAVESISNLRKALVSAPDGNTDAVLRAWEKDSV